MTTSGTVTVTYAGDTNHNGASTSFTLKVDAIRVVTTTNNGGTVKVNGLVQGTTDEIVLGSKITFTATPESGYGLIKYVVAGNTTYISTSTNLTAVYTSAEITVTEDLLTNNILNIDIIYDKVKSVTVTSNSSSITNNISSKYEDNRIAHIYKDNVLTVFESSDIILDIEAKQVSGQYFVINTVITDGNKEVLNTVKTTIIKAANEVSRGIEISALKAYNAEDKEVVSGSQTVGTLEVTPKDNNNKVIIDNEKFVVENSKVDIKISVNGISPNGEEYGFVGIKIGENTITKDRFDVGVWTYDDAKGEYTWNNQSYSEEMSTVEAILMEKWYTTGNNKGRVVEVNLADGVTAELTNTDIGYTYLLEGTTFGNGSEPLYAGNWEIGRINSNTGVRVKVRVYTGTSYTEYGVGEAFEINAEVTKVTIEISKV
jgi:hypothetical protein